jgi:hypothetical protein
MRHERVRSVGWDKNPWPCVHIAGWSNNANNKVSTNERFIYLLHCVLQSDDEGAARREVVVRQTLAVAD